MKKINEAFASLFRWIVSGIISFIIALPAFITFFGEV